MRQLLRQRGSGDEVAAFGDCLAFGPIASGDWDERAKWLDEIHPAPADIGPDWVKESAEDFLSRVQSSTFDRLVWIAPRSACEQCGLQWYFEQFPGAPAGPMIIADGPIQFERLEAVPLGLGELAVEYMSDLFDNAPRREWPAERASPDEWRRLRAEDSLLRIVEDGFLRSADPDRFDPLLLGRCTSEWQKWSRLVGWAMVDAMDQGHQVGDTLILWRLRELIEAGRIECKGQLPSRDHDATHRPNAMLRLAI